MLQRRDFSKPWDTKLLQQPSWACHVPQIAIFCRLPVIRAGFWLPEIGTLVGLFSLDTYAQVLSICVSYPRLCRRFTTNWQRCFWLIQRMSSKGLLSLLSPAVIGFVNSARVS